VLSNESDQPILAISAHWTIVGQDGKEHGSRLRCESIFTSGKPVLLSHSNILLGPSTCATAAGASSVGRIAASERNNLQVVIDAVEVRIQVDGILFGNGDMFGGDGPFYAAELKERAIAAGEVALYVRAALGEGNGRPQACLLASQHAHAARAASVGSKGGWHESFFGPLTMLADKDEKAFDLYLDRLSTVKLPVPIVVRDRE
jgi:hypothetical protein